MCNNLYLKSRFYFNMQIYECFFEKNSLKRKTQKMFAYKVIFIQKHFAMSINFATFAR